jgi:cyanophycinase
MKIRGKLVIIGGAEDKGEKEDSGNFTHEGILSRIIDESAQGKRSSILIIPAASSTPEEVGNDYIKAFKKLNVTNVRLLLIDSREKACGDDSVALIKKADVVFFTGGDQVKLTSIIGGTPFFQVLRDRLQTDNKFMYAGTSAGAAAASESMIMNGSSENALLKGEVQTSTGFGFAENTVFDTHFMSRGRIGRLFQIIVTNPSILGVGLEENTGLLIHNNKMEAIGPGMTILVDGTSISNTNLLEIKEQAPLSIDYLKVLVMSKTDIYDLESRTLKILTPEECKA